MIKNATLAAVAAATIAVSTIVPTGLAYAAAPTPWHKPLVCIFIPVLDICTPPAPPKPVMHHHKMMKPKKP